jgi:hypothetical protein
MWRGGEELVDFKDQTTVCVYFETFGCGSEAKGGIDTSAQS